MSGWTEERIDTLKAMWAEGKTARECGDVLGVSRNAILGKVNRLGLSVRQAPQKPKKAAPAEPRPAPAPVPERSLTLVPLGQVEDSTCRWPEGDPRDADFGFCGARCSADRPYCDAHSAVAYQRKRAA